jgi:hypothetical protein
MNARHDARRAADQVDRQVDQHRDTADLVAGLGADHPETAGTSERALSAMTPPPHDPAAVRAMTEGPATEERAPRRRGWWQRLFRRR